MRRGGRGNKDKKEEGRGEDLLSRPLFLLVSSQHLHKLKVLW